MPEGGLDAGYVLTGATEKHLNNHFIHVSALPDLQIAVLEFLADPDIEETGEISRFNDMSLVFGGGFDVFGNWRAGVTLPGCRTTGHCWHKEGIDVDIENLNRLQDLREALELNGWCFIDEGQTRLVNPTTKFLHFRYRGKGKCPITR